MAENWDVVLVSEVAEWFERMAVEDPDSANLIEDAVDLLAEHGPLLGRPLVDSVHSSTVHNMKELRPPSRGRSEIRVLFVFDPFRRAVLLVAGDKAGDWSGWYDRNIPVAEERYDMHLSELYEREYE